MEDHGGNEDAEEGGMLYHIPGEGLVSFHQPERGGAVGRPYDMRKRCVDATEKEGDHADIHTIIAKHGLEGIAGAFEGGEAGADGGAKEQAVEYPVVVACF